MKQEGIYEAVSRKRENVLKNARVGEIAPEYEVALEQMESYLRSQKKRCTIERRYVLEVLYRLDWPIDTALLHDYVCEMQGNVALTTIYNTLELLEQLHLVRRIELVNHGMTFFERSLGLEPHGFVICNECGSLRHLRLSSLMPALQTQLPTGFEPQDFTLQIHGLCAKCQRATLRKKKKHPKTTTK